MKIAGRMLGLVAMCLCGGMMACHGSGSNWLLGKWQLKTPKPGCKPWYIYGPTTETHDFYGQTKSIDVTYAITSANPDDIGVMGNLGNGFMYHRLGPNEMRGEGGCVYARQK